MMLDVLLSDEGRAAGVVAIDLFSGSAHVFRGKRVIRDLIVDKSDRIEQAVFAGLFECVQCGNCTMYCPSLISGMENIKEMMDLAEERGMKPDAGNETKYWPML